LSGCLLGVIAQRLVRTLCPNCRSEYDISLSPQTFQEIEPLLGEGEGKAIYGPSGCEECFHLGYVGRTGLFEVMTINQELRRLVSGAASSQSIEEAANRAGMTVFRRGALLKVAQGVTSTEEILRDVPAEQLGLED
jgi:type II secretory ATPase GspE/PulE/Tfp pilus assembly ATPase PilB-like protein